MVILFSSVKRREMTRILRPICLLTNRGRKAAGIVRVFACYFDPHEKLQSVTFFRSSRLVFSEKFHGIVNDAVIKKKIKLIKLSLKSRKTAFLIN